MPTPPSAPSPSFTADNRDVVLRALSLGGTIAMAARASGVDRRTIYRWLERGQADLDAGLDTEHAAFLVEVEKAKGRGDLQLLASVAAQTQGRRCRTCAGSGSLRARDAGGRPDDNRLVRCSACKGSGFATLPDGRLALDMLARRYPADFGLEARHRIEHTGEGGGPIQLDTRVAAVAVDLVDLDPAQLAALAYGALDQAAEPPLLAEAAED